MASKTRKPAQGKPTPKPVEAPGDGRGRRRLSDEASKKRTITLDETNWKKVQAIAKAATGEANVSGLLRGIGNGTVTAAKAKQ